MANETVRILGVKITITGEVTGPDVARVVVNQSKEVNFADGAGQNQLGAVWQDTDGSLATTTATLDLDGLTDFKGSTMSDNSKLRIAYFENNSDTGNLVVGGGDFAGWFADASDKMVIKPRGFALICDPLDGYTITASTGDGLLLETTASVNYKALLGFKN